MEYIRGEMRGVASSLANEYISRYENVVYLLQTVKLFLEAALTLKSSRS